MMLEEMNSIPNPTQKEINERKLIAPIIKAKAKFGLGVVKKKKITEASEMDGSACRGASQTGDSPF
jgi:hypothetical protein